MKVRLLAAVTSVALASAAFGYEPAVTGYDAWFNCYRVNFTNDVGAALSDAMIVKGGTWGRQPVPDGATAVIGLDYTGRNLAVDCVESESGIKFDLEKRRTNNRWAHRFVLRFPESEAAPQIDADAKAALSVVAEGDGTTTNFVGYTAAGWTNLVCSKSAAFDNWYDCVTVFENRSDGLYISYRVLFGDEYETLTDGDGEGWFRAGGSGMVFTGIEIFGKGDVMYIDGGVSRTAFGALYR